MEKKRCYGCMRPMTTEPFCEHCGYDSRTANAPHQLPAGTVLHEQYLVGKVLGQGGFGITYLGWDLYLDIPVAIKEYYPSGMVMRETTATLSVTNCLGDDGSRFQNNRDRFMREAKMLARFSYVPEIVQIKNFFLANNTAYIVMEYVQGITLKEYIRRRGGRLSVDETFAILRPIIVGLSKIHKAGLIHRDISPDNIMMIPGGGAKLLDFGAVRDVGAASVDKELTKSTEAILKQGYAPIEQYQQKGSLGPWTDVYALCATICYCLTGQVPPDAPARMLGDEQLVLDPRMGLSPDQQRALIRGMALKAADRQPNMEVLYLDLFDMPIPSEEAAAPVQKEPEKPRQPEKPEPVRKKSKWWIPVLAVLLIAAAVGIWWKLKPGESRLADIAPTEETQLQTEETTESTPETQPQRPVVRDPDENTLMEHTVQDSETAPGTFAFGTQVRREQVASITVLYTTQDAPSDAVDVSRDGNGKVLAWTQPNGELYDLYLAAEGGIYAPANSMYLFACFPNLKTIEFNEAFFTDNVENACAMFYRDSSLVELDVTGFNTSNITDMSHMFADCEMLESLDVSKFDTSGVTAMNSMFQFCPSLRTLDVSNFDTSNVTSMRYMFTQCTTVEALDVSNFDTAKVQDMQYMFNECMAVKQLDVSGFKTANVTNMCYMFADCAMVESLDVTGFETANVSDMRYMFADCAKLKLLDLSSFDTAKVTNMSFMFRGCAALTNLDVSEFNTEKVTTMSSMFEECSSLTALDVSDFDTVRVTSTSYMFRNCSSLTALDVSGFDTANVTNMACMFSGCAGITALDVSGFSTANVTDMSFMFSHCESLEALDVSGFKTENVTTMEAMFQCCYKVPALSVGMFDTSKVTSMSYMFTRCYALQQLNLAHFRTGNVTQMIAMFNECTSMTRLDVTGFDTTNVTTMARLFCGCSGLSYLNVEGLETQNVQDMEHMFDGCSNLNYLNLRDFRTSNVQDMQYMFNECRTIKSLDVSHFDTSNVQDMDYMFYGCDSLTDLKLGAFDTSSVAYHENFMEAGRKVDGQDWKELFA